MPYGHPFHAVEGIATVVGAGVAIRHTEDHLEGRSSLVYAVRPDLRSDDPAAHDAALWARYVAGRADAERRRASGLAQARDLDRTARL
ncbi:MAG: hypothetical protein IPK78_02125 [Rhodospirillales bacterium]|nr:hypothetical protein [Rhodospirillales bacterium]